MISLATLCPFFVTWHCPQNSRRPLRTCGESVCFGARAAQNYDILYSGEMILHTAPLIANSFQKNQGDCNEKKNTVLKVSPDLLRNFVCVSVLCTRIVIYTLRSIISFHVPFSLSLFTVSLLWSIPSGLQLIQNVLLRLNRKRGQERQIIFYQKKKISQRGG